MDTEHATPSDAKDPALAAAVEQSAKNYVRPISEIQRSLRVEESREVRSTAAAELVDNLTDYRESTERSLLIVLLQRMMEDEYSIVRRWGIEGLGEIGDVASANNIASIALDPGCDEYERVEALESLQSLDPQLACSTLIQLAEEVLPSYLQWVVKTQLGLVDPTRDLPSLYEAAVLDQELFYRLIDLINWLARPGDVRLRATIIDLQRVLDEANALEVADTEFVQSVLRALLQN